ncbi:TIGR02452 family protein, partial [Streptomyces lydicus]
MSARLRGMAQETERIVAAGVYRAPGGRTVDLAAAVVADHALGAEAVGGQRTETDRLPVLQTDDR